MQNKSQKFMILCVAGQSNAVGYDESCVKPGYVERFRGGRIRQLGIYGADNLKPIPLGVCAQSYQDLRPYSNPDNQKPNLGTKGIHLPLCNLLLDDIPEDYQILVISCAYGGTGFTVGEPGSHLEKELRPEPGILRWGEDSAYYMAMRARIEYALNLFKSGGSSCGREDADSLADAGYVRASHGLFLSVLYEPRDFFRQPLGQQPVALSA